MGIIDFRVRPLYKGYTAMAERKTTDKFLNAFRMEPTPSIINRSLDLLVKEMDESGVDISVVPGRQTDNTYISNSELFEIEDLYPGRFIIFPLYDPLNSQASLNEIKEFDKTRSIKGVTIEPGFGNQLRFDDPQYEPLYNWLEERQLPLMTTFSGSITSIFDQTLPERLHRVAKNHPNLNIVVGHGGWPWARELMCMAFFTNNIYLAPDLYAVRCPGSEDYKEAADNMLRDRCIFGSSYPLTTVKEAVDMVKNWNLHKDAEEMYFYENAKKLLKL